jgi:hypothetical protein
VRDICVRVCVLQNWGCITYRETALLVDPDHSSAQLMQRVARTVCHEIAHMWFGNLVTMEYVRSRHAETRMLVCGDECASLSV